MILNLLRVEAFRVEEMIKRSFSENASQRLLPDQQRKVIEVCLSSMFRLEGLTCVIKGEKRLGTLAKLSCGVCQPSIEDYYDISAQVLELNQRILEMATGHQQGLKSLASGRVVILKDGVRFKGRSRHVGSLMTL